MSSNNLSNSTWPWYDTYNSPIQTRTNLYENEFERIQEFKYIDAPEGFRPLKNNEVIKKGDKFRNTYIDINNPFDKYFDAGGEIGKIYKLKDGWLPGFRKIKNLSYSDKDKNRIINILKSERAFNADSATTVGDDIYDICDDLEEKGIIKCINNRFWFEGEITA